MSRYHSVRPRKHKHKHHQVPQPAAPAQPTEAEAEKYLHVQLEKARTELYKLNNGDVLDEAIARWKRMLAIYDREAEVVHNGEPGKLHRWTVSPSMALRAEKHLEGLLNRRDKLLNECHTEAHKIVTDLYARHALRPDSGQAKDDALCPPKQTPATRAESEATNPNSAADAIEGGTAAPPSIAA